VSDSVIIEVVRTHAEGKIQVSISQVDEHGVGWGHRIAGPKHYNMGTTPLLSKSLDAEDAKALRGMLDAVFPPDSTEATECAAGGAE
jgi:hypothetical protein